MTWMMWGNFILGYLLKWCFEKLGCGISYWVLRFQNSRAGVLLALIDELMTPKTYDEYQYLYHIK